MLLLNSVSARRNNSEIGVDFTKVVFVQIALRTAISTPQLMDDITQAGHEKAPLSTELLPELQSAYDGFCAFLQVYANKTGVDTPDQIIGNIHELLGRDTAALILDRDWS